MSSPRYIYEQALTDPETALTLVDREQARLFSLLLVYLDLREAAEEEDRSLSNENVLPVAKSLHKYIDHFLKDIIDAGADCHVLEAASDRQARGTLLISMHETLVALTKYLALEFESPSLNSLCISLREGLGALLLMASDTVRSLDPSDFAMMRKLTGDRDGVINKLRNRAISASQILPPQDRERLYTCTNEFELMVWMLRRYMGTVSVQVDSSSKSVGELAIA